MLQCMFGKVLEEGCLVGFLIGLVESKVRIVPLGRLMAVQEYSFARFRALVIVSG